MLPRYLFLLGLLSSCFWAKPGPSATLLAGPIQVGTAKQVFIDGRFLGSKQGLELVVNRPRATGEMLLVPEHPWESGWIGDYLSVIQEGGRVHMWYDSSDRTAIQDPKQGMTGVAYAYSSDGGAPWVKPRLGAIEYGGSTENNLVIKDVHGFHLFRNRPDAPADEKYVLFSGQPNKLFVSGDGFHWKAKGREPFLNMAGHSGLDSQNVMFWDSRIERYVAYPRINLPPFNRTVGRSESPTLGDFPDPVVVLRRDNHDPPEMDFYTSAAIQYPFAAEAYYMFPAAYHHWPSPPHPSNDGPLDVQFAASRDGVDWKRPNRHPIIRLGLELIISNHQENFDHGAAGTDILWGGPKGYSRSRRTNLPTVGVHLDSMVDSGNVYDRRYRWEYEFDPVEAPQDTSFKKLRWTGKASLETRLEF